MSSTTHRTPTVPILDDALYGPEWTGWALVPALVAAFLALPVGISRVSRGADMRMLLSRRAWAPVRVHVAVQDTRWEFVTAEGVVCRLRQPHRVAPDGPRPADKLRLGAAHGDPADQPVLRWATYGTTAVFSGDRGHPLILARRR